MDFVYVKVYDDNEALKIRLATAGVNVDSPQEGNLDATSDRGNRLTSVAELESQVRRLKAENAVFQKTLDGMEWSVACHVTDMHLFWVERCKHERLCLSTGLF